MAYGDFKDLARRTVSDRILCDKAFDIAKNAKYDGYQRGLASMIYKFFDKKISGSVFKSYNMSDQQLILGIAWFLVQLTLNLTSGN